MVEMSAFTKLSAWIAWIVATAVSGGVALLLSAGMVHLMMSVYHLPDIAAMSGDDLVGPYLLWTIGLFLFVGPLLGLEQALVLKVFTRVSWLAPWVGISTLGVILNLIVVGFIGIAVGDITPPIVILPGFIQGSFQWLALRHSTVDAPRWILASSLGWIAAVVVGYQVAASILPATWRGKPFYPIESVIYLALTSSIVLAIFAAVVGAVLFNSTRRVIGTQV